MSQLLMKVNDGIGFNIFIFNSLPNTPIKAYPFPNISGAVLLLLFKNMSINFSYMLCFSHKLKRSMWVVNCLGKGTFWDVIYFL